MSGSAPGPRSQARIELLDDPTAINRAQDEVVAAMIGLGFGSEACFAVRLAMEEAIYNAVRHGHAQMPDEAVGVSWAVSEGEVEIVVEDRGPGFDPEGVPDPTTDERLEMPHGRGLMLMRAYMTSVGFNGKGNRVRMVYRRAE